MTPVGMELHVIFPHQSRVLSHERKSRSECRLTVLVVVRLKTKGNLVLLTGSSLIFQLIDPEGD